MTTTPTTITLDTMTGREAIELETLSGISFTALMAAYEAGDTTMRSLLAIVYVISKRTDSDLDWDEFQDRDLNESIALLDDGEEDSDEDSDVEGEG